MEGALPEITGLTRRQTAWSAGRTGSQRRARQHSIPGQPELAEILGSLPHQVRLHQEALHGVGGTVLNPRILAGLQRKQVSQVCLYLFLPTALGLSELGEIGGMTRVAFTDAHQHGV